MRWMHDTLSYFLYSGTEILFYASVGPLATYWVKKPCLSRQAFRDARVVCDESRLYRSKGQSP